MKKLILLFCALGMAVSSWGYDFTTDGIYYNISSATNKTVAVTYKMARCYSGDVTIPSTVTNAATGITYSVDSIGNHAFYYCSSLKSITIPSTVKAIGEGSFESCALTTITIPASVTSIGCDAFNYCTSLTDVDITSPSLLTSIGEGAFFQCTSLSSFIIPPTVTTIGRYSFEWCALTTITIPASVTFIGSNAFAYCLKVASLKVDKANTAYVAVDSVLFTKDLSHLVCYPANRTGTAYTIPSTVNIIDSSAFAQSSLTSVIIPSSVTSIKSSAFDGCKKLTSITIPSSIISIGDNTFSGCSNLTSISIPSSVTSIGKSAFYYCYNIASITLQSGVTSIGAAAFCCCLNVRSISIPSTVTTIENSTFQSCNKLTSVTIPSSITSIGNDAFLGCSALTNIYAYPTTPVSLAYSSDVFRDVDTTACTLHVPSGSLTDYKAANVWKGFKTIVDDLKTTSGTAEAIASTAKVTVHDGQAVITGAVAGTALSVYNLQGTAIYTGKASGETESVGLPGRGVYIVRVGRQSVKVIY